jgi:hypothetical protein
MTELSIEERAWVAYRAARRTRRIKGWMGVAIFGCIAGSLWAMPFVAAPPATTGEVVAPPAEAEGYKTIKVKPNTSIRAGDAPMVFAFGFVIAVMLGSFVMGVYETFERRRVAESIAAATPTDG